MKRCINHIFGYCNYQSDTATIFEVFTYINPYYDLGGRYHEQELEGTKCRLDQTTCPSFLTNSQLDNLIRQQKGA